MKVKHLVIGLKILKFKKNQKGRILPQHTKKNWTHTQKRMEPKKNDFQKKGKKQDSKARKIKKLKKKKKKKENEKKNVGKRQKKKTEKRR